MRITITQPSEKGFRINLPTRWTLSRPAAWILARTLAKQGVCLSSGDLYRFMKAARSYKDSHPGWVLVEVNSADGEQITVTI